MKDFKVDASRRAEGNPIRKELVYWSDALGEPKKDGKTVDQEALPRELRTARKELWSNRFRSLCYLAQYQGDYGIALVNEFDPVTASNENTDMDGLYGIMVKRIMDMEDSPAFSEMSFLAGQWTGFGDCHEAILFVPWNVPKERVERGVRIFDNIYTATEERRPALEVHRLTETAILPKRDDNGAPWFSLQADISEPVVIRSGETASLETGVEVRIPEGCIGEVHARGKLAAEKRLYSVDTIIGGRNFVPVRILLENRSKDPQTIRPGERIARLVIQQCALAEIEEV